MSRSNWRSNTSLGLIIATAGWPIALILMMVVATDFFSSLLEEKKLDAEEIKCRGREQARIADNKAAARKNSIPADPDESADPEKTPREYCAQRRATLAAERQAVYAGAALGVGLVALLAAIGAAVAAGLAASETGKTVTTMQGIAAAELRAYVSASNFQHAALTDAARVVHHWVINPSWENSGNTPTKRMVNHVSWDVFDHEPPAGFAYPDMWAPGAPQIRVPLVLGPKTTVQGEEVSIPVALLVASRQGATARVYIWGWAEYNDMLPGTPRHRTEFCVWLDPRGDPTVPNASHIVGRFYGPHNGSDDDCMKQPQTS
jgi:hypothetical protein